LVFKLQSKMSGMFFETQCIGPYAVSHSDWQRLSNGKQYVSAVVSVI